MLVACASHVMLLLAQPLPKGQVLDTILCSHDSTQSYALYIPTPKARHDLLLPIIYIFDPMGRGRQGIEVFRHAAEEYGFILVCSNNARNGNWEVVFDAANAVFIDTEKRLSLNPLRRYTAGFSGGSRAATALAVLAEGKIRGVIGCGAGYPPVISYQPDATDSFLYLGLVGHRDMNFYEHHNTQLDLQRLGLSNQLYYFAGGHQWPPPEAIALALLEIQIRHTHLPRNTAVAAYLRSIYTHAEEMHALHFSTYARSRLMSALDLVKIKSEKLSQLADRILQAKHLKRQVRIQQKITSREGQLIDTILSRFRHIPRDFRAGNLDFDWWKKEIKTLHDLRDQETLPLWQYLGARMINLITARCAELVFRWEEKQEFDLVTALINIWIFAAPDSAYAHWYRAKIAAKQGKESAVLNALQKAVESGLSNQAAFDHPAFSRMSSLPAFQSLREGFTR